VVGNLRSVAQVSGSVEVGMNPDLNQPGSHFAYSPQTSVDLDLG